MDEDTYKRIKNRLKDVHMRLELLKSKQDRPYYDEEYAKAKDELASVRHELAHYKMMELEEKSKQEVGGRK